MTEPIYLPQVTMVAITDRDHGKTIEAIHKSLKHIKPFRTILFSDVYLESDLFENILIDPLRSAKKYNEFVTWKLGHYIDTSHILLVQYDGYVIDGSAWKDEFLQYDYIGAPWNYTDGRNVGNGGFSLRTKRLHDILATDPFITVGSPEDEIICRLFRGYLETHHGIKYAPEALAHQFSFEMHRPKQKTFGFHNYFHRPYKEPIILRRNHAMGDVIMLEPVMEYYYRKGYRVILDCLPEYYNLFAQHYFPVEFFGDLNEDTSSYRVVNLDMSYESFPKELVLKTYFKMCGVDDYQLRNSKLNYGSSPDTKMFKKYAILHINETDMPHRNLHDICWPSIVAHLKAYGFEVFQIGRGGTSYTTRINTPTQNMMAYIVAGANLFIGSDSGIGQVAVACGVKSVLFFGSVDPKLRYPDLSNITIIQSPCEFAGCYHSEISERGVDCRFNKEKPPCATYSTDEIIKKLNQIL